MNVPRALKSGDTIGIAAPASPFDRKKFIKGIHVLEKLGFETFYRHDIFDQSRYLAGSDNRRTEELSELFSNKNISAIMFARGGYGSQRIIPLLDVSFLANHKKPVIGFSDVTALLAFLNQKAGMPTFYGPVITQLGAAEKETTADAFFKAITTGGPLGQVLSTGSKALKAGSASGKLIGGCLSLICSSMGTPYELDTEGSILFIEDAGEKVYVLDRMLTQLKNAGKFDGVGGVIFGSLIPPEDEPHDVEAMILDVLSDFTGPIMTNFPAGHVDEFITLPLNVAIDLDVPIGGEPSVTCTSGLLT